MKNKITISEKLGAFILTINGVKKVYGSLKDAAREALIEYNIGDELTLFNRMATINQLKGMV